MNCEEAGRLLDAYLDRELEWSSRLELQEHLSLCPSCWSLAQERQEFRTLFRATTSTYKAPSELRKKILVAVRREKTKQAFALFRQPWVYAAGVFILCLSLVLNILFPDSGKEISRQAVLCHSRSISPEHLVDVNSANPLVVKSWLAARLDFSPPVVASPASAYALLGGRVDVIQNRTVATIVYKSDKDLITLFCWPPKREQLPQREYVINGYHVHIWSNAECNYILISKFRGPETDGFTDSFRDQLQSGAYF
ncbi:MAG: anti-sigma factor [Verrucomicrobia bacterium]|nr:anti-sigma factor [Verrucomicrobiota bacterium]